MNSIDIVYQKAVDEEAEKILKLTITDFIKIGEYGTIEKIINGKKTAIGWWHYKFNNNLHHVFFQTSRRFLLIFHRIYLSGVKLENDKLLTLTNEELDAYS
jgi:hypothetical protein